MKEILRLDATSLGSNAPGFLHASQSAQPPSVAMPTLGENRQDTVSVSVLAQNLNAKVSMAGSKTDETRLSGLRQHVVAGTLKIDLERIAEHMTFDVSDV
jgi:anti-sigma28 factor (negative regulator of flagellin synthesis)